MKQNIIPTNADDQYHGLYIWYHPNGNISTKRRYVNGVWDGIVELYMYDGELIYKSYKIKDKYVYCEWYGSLNEIEFNI